MIQNLYNLQKREPEPYTNCQMNDLSYWYKMAFKKCRFSYIVMIANRSISVNGWQNLQALIPYVMM